MKALACWLVAALLLAGRVWAADPGGDELPDLSASLRDGARVQFDGTYYDYRAADGRKMIKMWVPPGISPVRGMFVTGHGGGSGDSRSFPRDPSFRAYAVRHGFAVVGLHWFPGRRVYGEGAGVFVEALDAFAALGRHPEIAHLPFVVFGGSNGGATSYGLANALPQRAICFTPNAAAWWNPEVPSDAAIEVPAIFALGLFDPFMRETGIEDTRQLVADARARGARWALIAEEKGHEDGATWQIFTRFWDRCITLRLPQDANPSAGPVALQRLDEDSGWLVGPPLDSGLPEIAPFGEYRGDRAAAGWVPDADVAFLYRSVATAGQPLILSSRDVGAAFNPDTDYRSRLVGVADPPVAPGTSVRVECDAAGLPGWQKLEFYDGAELLGTVEAGADPSFVITVDRSRRVHNVTALGYDAEDAVHVSTPLYFYVGDPAAAILSAAEQRHPTFGASASRGSETASSGPAAFDPADHVLVAYGLSAAQERAFDASDGQASPFWELIGDGHDHISMTQRENAPNGNGFSVVLNNDARLLVKAAHSAAGLYLYLEATDNRFVDVANENIYEHFDAADVLLDSRSSREICTGDADASFVNRQWGLSLTSKQYQIGFGDSTPPSNGKRNRPDPWDMHYDLVALDDLAARHGFEVDFIDVDRFRRAQEWFIPWSEVGGGLDGEPSQGSRIGFAPGYNDRDPGEYLDSGGYDRLRWVERSSPWEHASEQGECPMGWGDVEIGPFISPGR